MAIAAAVGKGILQNKLRSPLKDDFNQVPYFDTEGLDFLNPYVLRFDEYQHLSEYKYPLQPFERGISTVQGQSLRHLLHNPHFNISFKNKP